MVNVQLLKSSINNDFAIGMQAVFHTNDLIVITLDNCCRLLIDDLVNLIRLNRNVYLFTHSHVQLRGRQFIPV